MQNLEGIGPLEGSEMTSLETFSMENIEYLQSIEGLKSENWLEMQPLERLDALRTLESRLAEIQGRPPLPVVAEQMEGQTEGFSGYYDGEALHINIEYLEDPAYRLEVIDTVAHEGRHAYQQYAIEHPGFHPNQQEVMYWAANEQTYIQGDRFGYEYYRNQPMELDAWNYGEMTRNVFSELQDDNSFWKYDSNMEVAFAKVENNPLRPSLLEQAGDLCLRIKAELDAIIPPSVQKSILRAGVLSLIQHHL